MNDTSNTTNAASQSDIPQSVSDFMRHITDLCGGEHARWAENFSRIRQYTHHHRETA